MTARNIVYVASSTVPVSPIANSAFTHAIVSTCHLNQNPALQTFRILTGPTGITTLFSADDFSQWISALNGGTFPETLRTASAEAFSNLGEPLSNDVTVTVNTAGESWTLTDNTNAVSYPMQVDPNGTYVSFNGGPLTKPITDYSSYEKSLNAGTFPSSLQTLANLPGDNSDYTVTQVPAQTNGLAQWLITNTTNGYIYFVKLFPAQGTAPITMKVTDIQYVYSENVSGFMSTLSELQDADVTMLASFGGYGVDGDWQIMGQDLQQALIVVAQFFDTYGISGIDYDWEMPSEPPQQQTADIDAMTQFTQSIQTGRPGTICTICPYGATVSQLLEVWTNAGFDAIAFANCQNYSPDNNPPSDVTGTFLTPISQAFPSQLSAAADAAPYINVGFTATGLDATQFAKLVSQVVDGNPPKVPAIPNLGGAFTYNLENMSGSVTTWATDVADALSGSKVLAAAR